MKDCAACGSKYKPAAEGQIVCSFKCAKHLQARGEALERAQRQARIDLIAGKKVPS